MNRSLIACSIVSGAWANKNASEESDEKPNEATNEEPSGEPSGEPSAEINELPATCHSAARLRGTHGVYHYVCAAG
jgi:hypothetical protein